MRLKNLFGMAAMLALAASCSENELVESGGTSQAGTSYAAFNIVLPTTNSTRATTTRLIIMVMLIVQSKQRHHPYLPKDRYRVRFY